MTMPKLQAQVIFMDIDDTITISTGMSTGRSILGDLVDVVAKANQLDPKAARAKIDAVMDVENEALDGHYAALGIAPHQFWVAMMKWMPKQITGCPDAVKAIPQLHARGFRLFTATTNSGLICRAKLAAAGIADEQGCPYFERLLGGSEVHPKGKSTPEFYRNLLKIAGVRPEEVVHVGDNPKADLELPRQAGITQVVLPRRDQKEEWVWEADGGIYVKSLDILLEMVRRMEEGLNIAR